jgi:ssDNA-binding Zn-finger/Zn-ribbon topoisomerase 1
MPDELNIQIKTNEVKFHYPDGSIKYLGEKPCPMCSGKMVTMISSEKGDIWGCLNCDYEEERENCHG